MKNIADLEHFEQLDNLEFVAAQVVEGFITGLHKSPYHGFSVEFAEHRIYNNGESTKNIDWKLFARTEKLFVKRFEEETNLRSYIVLDTSSSMYYPKENTARVNKLQYSVYCASALIYLLRKQRDAVALSCFADTLELHTDSRLSSTHSKYLFSELTKLFNTDAIDNKRTNASQILHEIAENIHKRSLVIIFSDMIDSLSQDDLFAAMQHFRYNKHEVILFHVTDHKHEGLLQLENRPYRLIDMEDGTELKLNPNDIRQEYIKRMSTFNNELKIKCGQYNIDLVEADINEDFSTVLLPYIIKRSQLY